jgi:hypothetical protein
MNNIEGTIFRKIFRGISEGNKGIKGMKRGFMATTNSPLTGILESTTDTLATRNF